MIISSFNKPNIKNFDDTVRMIFDHSEAIDYHLTKFVEKCQSYMLRNPKKNHSVLLHDIEVLEAVMAEREKTV